MDKYRELERMQAELQVMRYSLGASISEVKGFWLEYTKGIERLLKSEDIYAMCLYVGRPFKDSNGYYIQLNIGRLGEGRLRVYDTEIRSTDMYSISCPTNTHTNVQELVAHLRGIGTRRRQWLEEQAALKRCRTCYYGGAAPYCGLGMEVVGCNNHMMGG